MGGLENIVKQLFVWRVAITPTDSAINRLNASVVRVGREYSVINVYRTLGVNMEVVRTSGNATVMKDGVDYFATKISTSVRTIDLASTVPPVKTQVKVVTPVIVHPISREQTVRSKFSTATDNHVFTAVLARRKSMNASAEKDTTVVDANRMRELVKMIRVRTAEVASSLKMDQPEPDIDVNVDKVSPDSTVKLKWMNVFLCLASMVDDVSMNLVEDIAAFVLPG